MKVKIQIIIQFILILIIIILFRTIKSVKIVWHNLQLINLYLIVIIKNHILIQIYHFKILKILTMKLINFCKKWIKKIAVGRLYKKIKTKIMKLKIKIILNLV